MKKVPVPFLDPSFYPKKNLNGMGDAGMVVTDNPEFADKLRRIRVPGSQTREVHDLAGGNFRRYNR